VGEHRRARGEPKARVLAGGRLAPREPLQHRLDSLQSAGRHQRPVGGSVRVPVEDLGVASIGERARELLARLARDGDGIWHPRREDRETLMELSERLELDLPLDAFRAPEVASAFLRRALAAIRG
jgi:hypothetical protein